MHQGVSNSNDKDGPEVHEVKFGIFQTIFSLHVGEIIAKGDYTEDVELKFYSTKDFQEGGMFLSTSILVNGFDFLVPTFLAHSAILLIPS